MIFKTTKYLDGFDANELHFDGPYLCVALGHSDEARERRVQGAAHVVQATLQRVLLYNTEMAKKECKLC